MLKYKKIILIAIIALAFVLRFYHLNSYPALNADEASIGYDAYSLIQTGHDQHGNAWPIDFQSFNDYKPGLYVYVVLPFVKLLGLNEWAVRIPNALIGVATVFAIYLLVKELFGKDKELLALVSALFLAISPWHIQFSRGGWEVNTALFLMTLGVLFFHKGLTRNKYKYLAIIFFVLSMYCYQATRVVTPLIGLGLILIYRKEIFKDIKPYLTAGFVGFLILVPLLLDFTHGGVLNRAAGVGLFADPGPRSRVEEQRGEHGHGNDSIFTKAIHNKVVNYAIAFADNWASHFHGEFLFLSGDAVTRNKVPETGQMYLIDIIFLSAGAVLIFKKKTTKEEQILLMWIAVGPVASALTFQAPSALRAENIVVPLIIIASYGCVELIKIIKDKKIQKIGIGIIVLLLVWGFARYLQMYYVHMAKEYQFSSQYGVKELVCYVEANQDKYRKILITDRYDQPYVLFLFYTKYSPAKFQAEHNLTQKDQFGLSTVNHFGKYYFASIKFDQAKTENPNTLIAGTNEEIPKEANIVKDIYGSNGFLYFRLVAN
jgi:4-amino-4-deoxy-L-arabinose transferase-like glycosyltransferase